MTEEELIDDEIHKQMHLLAQQMDIANLSLVLQLMQNCEKKKEWDNEKSHILADYMMIRLLEAVSESVPMQEVKQTLQKIIASYRRGVEEVWWHA